MVSLVNGSNIIAVAKTLTSGFLITNTIHGLADPYTMIELTSPETIIESVDPIAVFEWMTPGSGYRLLDVSEFPVELQESAREIKESAINTLIEGGKVAREDLAHPRSVLIRYPLDVSSDI